MNGWMPCLIGSAEAISLGHPVVDDYLELVRARARRNTLLAVAYDLKVFFGVVSKDPLDVKAVIERLRINHAVILDGQQPLFEHLGAPTDRMSRLEFCRPLAGTDELDAVLSNAPSGCKVHPLDAVSFEGCLWRDMMLSVFESAERYLTESLGFGLFHDDVLRAEAHASFWGGALVEIGAVTHPERRGRGYAPVVTAHRIAECERRGYTPYWACDVRNEASAAVARRLGYGQPREYQHVVYAAKGKS